MAQWTPMRSAARAPRQPARAISFQLTFYISIVALVAAAGCQSPQRAAARTDPAPEQPDLADRFGDGTPDFLRLDSDEDRRAFRHWLTFLAETQYYRQPKRLAREINDCAALIRFAYRQALAEHNGTWASELDLDEIPTGASVQKFTYPRT